MSSRDRDRVARGRGSTWCKTPWKRQPVTRSPRTSHMIMLMINMLSWRPGEAVVLCCCFFRLRFQAFNIRFLDQNDTSRDFIWHFNRLLVFAR